MQTIKVIIFWYGFVKYWLNFDKAENENQYLKFNQYNQ